MGAAIHTGEPSLPCQSRKYSRGMYRVIICSTRFLGTKTARWLIPSLFFKNRRSTGEGSPLALGSGRSRLSPSAAVGIVDPVNMPKDPFQPHKTVQFCH